MIKGWTQKQAINRKMRHDSRLSGAVAKTTLMCSFIVLLLFSSCASLQKMAVSSFEKPTVSVADIKLDRLSFEQVTLLFDIEITNPNLMAVNLAGFDYDLGMNNKSLVQGNQKKGLKIAAQSESMVQLPVTLNFKDLYQSINELRRRDNADYILSLGVTIEAPLLGSEHRLSINKQGQIPLPKLPAISLDALELKRLGFSGADLTVKVKVENPNAFDFGMNSINFSLQIAGAQWLNQKSTNQQKILAKKNGILSFPISLNFFEIGPSVLKLLKSSEPLDYDVEGEVEFNTSLPLIGVTKVPFALSGKVPVQK